MSDMQLVIDQLARIAWLEQRLRETTGELVQANDRIEALETALQACVQYHVKAAADNRAIAAVNQNNDLGENSLNHAVDHEIAAEDIGEIARTALTPEQE
jgi:hypothetical protein